MFKTPQFHSGGTGVIPGQGTKISHAMQTKIEEKKKKKKKVRKKGKRERGKEGRELSLTPLFALPSKKRPYSFSIFISSYLL